MATSLTIDSPVVTRTGNRAQVSIPIRAYMTENYAYRMRILVDGVVWQTGGVYQNIIGTFTEVIDSPEALIKNYHVELQIQSMMNGPFSVETSRYTEANIPVASYEISFDPNGGTMELETKTVYYGSEYGDLPYPRLRKYRFNGWYTDIDNGDRITEETVVGDVVPSIVYAHWSPLIGGKTTMKIDPEDYSIEMVRGDSAGMIVVCTDEPFENGDKIEFSVRRKVSSERLIHIVIAEFEEDEDGAAYIVLEPSDTQSLDFGKYVYDIQLTKANGWVTTIVETTEFLLKTEVTYND